MQLRFWKNLGKFTLKRKRENKSSLHTNTLKGCKSDATGREDFTPTVNNAIETFRKAREIAPHAGVVKSVLRLFDELVKCDNDGILKGVREVIEVNPLVE